MKTRTILLGLFAAVLSMVCVAPVFAQAGVAECDEQTSCGNPASSVQQASSGCENTVEFQLPTGWRPDLSELWVINSESEAGFAEAASKVDTPSAYLGTQRLAPNFRNFSPVPTKESTSAMYSRIHYSYPSAGQTMVVAMLWEKRTGVTSDYYRMYGVAQIVNGCEDITEKLKFIAEGGTDTPPPPPVKAAPTPAPAPDFPAYNKQEADIPVSKTGPITLTLMGTLSTPLFSAKFPRMHGEAVGHITSGNVGRVARNEFYRRQEGPSFQVFYSLVYTDFADVITIKNSDLIPAMARILHSSGTDERQLTTGFASISKLKGHFLTGTVALENHTAFVYERMAFSHQRLWSLRVVCRNRCDAAADAFFNSIVIK